MKLLSFILVFLFTVPLYAQKSKNKTDNQQVIFSEGISYSLPRTGIRIIVHARLTSYVPGPCSAWAEAYFGIKDIKNQPQSFWEIDEVSFETFAEPDPSQVYKTDLSSLPMLQMTQEGILAGFNTDVKSGKSSRQVTNSLTTGDKTRQMELQKQVQVPAQSGRTSPDQRAADAASIINKVRAVRYDIVAGMLDEFHPDGKAYEESLDELRRIEEENMALFTGKTTTEKQIFYYDYVPSSVSEKGVVIFRFDENLGFLPENDFSGKPVMIDIEKEEVPGGAPSVAETPGSVKTGISYRRPGNAVIRLSRELSVIAATRAVIAQFGTVTPLPAQLLSGAYSVEFHPETGAIKSITKK